MGGSKILLTFYLLLICFIFFPAAAAEADDVIIETEYMVNNPSSQWHIESARLDLVLPDESAKDYSIPREYVISEHLRDYRTDDKGNQLATYFFCNIAPGKTKSFKVVSRYEVPGAGVFDDLAEKSSLQDIEEIDHENFEIWTSPSTRIESNDYLIIEKAEELTEGKNNLYAEIEAVFEYVFQYVPDDLEDYDSLYANQGARSTLEVIMEYEETGDTDKNIVCEDYASLMVALLRASDIPARTVSGFRIPQNIIDNSQTITAGDMEIYRHMWVEYKAEKDGSSEWLVADPTPSYSSSDYFVDGDAYYFHDRHDLTRPARLQYRGYVELTSDDFKYEYSLDYTDGELRDEYENFQEKPEVALEGAEDITLNMDQVGFIFVDIHESSFDTIDSIRWISEDPTTLIIDNGYLVPVSSGESNIYAVVNGVRTRATTVTVESDESDYDLEKAILQLEDITLYPGRTFELPTLGQADFTGEDGPTINWSVHPDDTGVVSISNNTLEALREGRATIYAELGGETKDVSVRVMAEAAIEEIEIVSYDTFLVENPTEIQVFVYVVGDDGRRTPIAYMPVDMIAENPNVLEVEVIDEDHNIFEVTPKEFESTDLIASVEGLRETMEVAPEELDNLRIELEDEGSTGQYELQETDNILVSTTDSEYDDIISGVPMEWDYDEEVISVEGDPGSYSLEAVGPGTTVLQAFAGNTRSNGIMVAVEAPVMDGIEIELADDRIKTEETTTLTIAAEDDTGEDYDLSDRNVYVSAQHEDIVEITPTDDNAVYEITALREGDTGIEVSVGGFSDNASLEVYTPRPEDLDMRIPTDRLVIGEAMEIDLAATDQDGDEFDLSGSSIDLIISDDIVNVSNVGFQEIFIEGEEIGTLRMHAEVQGVRSNSESISIVPYETSIIDIEYHTNPHFIPGDTATIKAEARDRDGNTLDLSQIDAGIEWRIGNTNILEIQEEEVGDEYSELTVEAVGVGDTFVTASILGTRSARENIKVEPLLEYGIEKFKIDFGISRVNMNVGDSVTVRPYEGDDSVSGSVYSPDADNEILEVSSIGDNFVLEAVGTGSVELLFEGFDDVEDTSLVVIVGAPDEELHVGELVYDIKEKSTLPFPPTETSEVPFEDSADHWAKEDIAAATELGIVGGYEDGEFKPNNNVTRSEFAVMLVRALGIYVGEHDTSFEDLEGHWSEKSVEALRELDVIGGYEDGTFRPGNNITRAEVAAIISKTLAAETTAENKFADVDESSWSAPFINKVAGLGLVTGTADERFDPDKNTTRAEAVTILMRLLRGL